MKNKFFKLLLLFFFINCNHLYADSFSFDVKNIIIEDNGNLIYANSGKALSSSDDFEIVAEKFKYNKKKDFLEASNGDAFIKNQNLKIKFNKIKLTNQNNIITATNGIEINDLKKSLNIQGEEITFDRENNILFSETSSIIMDKNQNKINSKSFKYKTNEKNFRIFEALLQDNNKNTFEIESAYIDTQSNILIGENIIVNLNNVYFKQNNEPRLKGEKIKHSNNITEISKGIFTACKKTDGCPPWQLSAKKITHNSKKKTITYDDVWLQIYDIPVVYFPKFFHPDPTVKRQSGFLMPTFKNSPNNNTFFSIPYYKVLSENKDLTFSPRLYTNDQLLIQTELREAKKDGKNITDASVLFDKNNKTQGHLFFNLDRELNIDDFNKSNLKLNFEQVSDDTYLKANKLTSPIINDDSLLENSLTLNLTSNQLDIKSNLIMYEKLNTKGNDKYEYIFPKIELTKYLENKTKLDGNFRFISDNYIHNYNTNTHERVNTNNLIFGSKPKITKNGFYNNYEFILKNSNTNSQKSDLNKEGGDFYFSSLFQFNSSYPLIKKNKNKRSLLKPKLSAKFGPGHTKDLSKEEYILDVENIFNLNRISSEETLESGLSIAYGTDYILADENTNNEILSLKFANNLRLSKNHDLEKNNQLGSKTSNFFGEVKYNPFNFLTTKYNLATNNNLSDINYQNFIAEIKFNKFINTFDYLRQDGDKNSYFLNKTTYKFDEKNHLSFSTRENIKTDLTEYYNLIYQYQNDCLAASVEYQKEYYSDRDIKPSESIFFKLTIIPFGKTSSPNLKK